MSAALGICDIYDSFDLSYIKLSSSAEYQKLSDVLVVPMYSTLNGLSSSLRIPSLTSLSPSNSSLN